MAEQNKTFRSFASPTFDNKNTDPTDLAGLGNLELIFEGGIAGIDPFEVAGQDLGAVMAGFEDNFALGTLTLGGIDVVLAGLRKKGTVLFNFLWPALF